MMPVAGATGIAFARLAALSSTGCQCYLSTFLGLGQRSRPRSGSGSAFPDIWLSLRLDVLMDTMICLMVGKTRRFQ